MYWRGAGAHGRPAVCYTVAVTLFYLWTLGVIGAFSVGPLVHGILVIAVLFLCAGLMAGTRSRT